MSDQIDWWVEVHKWLAKIGGLERLSDDDRKLGRQEYWAQSSARDAAAAIVRNQVARMKL